MLTESVIREQIYNVDTSITIKTYTIVKRDNLEITRSIPTIKTLTPGDDYSQEDPDTKTMCAALWTPEVIAEYKASLAPSLEVSNG